MPVKRKLDPDSDHGQEHREEKGVDSPGDQAPPEFGRSPLDQYWFGHGGNVDDLNESRQWRDMGILATIPNLLATNTADQRHSRGECAVSKSIFGIWRGTVVVAGAMAGISWSTQYLHVTFDGDPQGLYSYDSCKAAFPGVTWNNGLSPDSGRVQVVQGGDTAWSGRSLRVSYPAGCLGPTGTGGAPSCGAQWRSVLASKHDTLMSRYYVLFPAGFEWVKGGKLPGLCGSQCNTGGNVPTGTDGWSARIMWRQSAQLVTYLYYAGQGGTYGTDLAWKDSTGMPLAVSTGKWHELTTKVMLNTPGANGAPGSANGRVQAWFDGRLALDSTGFRFRDLDTMHVDRFYFSTFFGGSTSDFEPQNDNRIFFDDFLVADSIAPARPTSLHPPRRAPATPSRPGMDGRKLLLKEPRGPLALEIDPSGRWSAVESASH